MIEQQKLETAGLNSAGAHLADSGFAHSDLFRISDFELRTSRL